MADQDLIATAKDTQDACVAREGDNRRDAITDMKFIMGEQWDADWMRTDDRQVSKAPMLVVNQLPQYINQVLNDIKQNRPAIKARPVDNKADKQLADIYGGIIRHAQDIGKSEMARDTAATHAVQHGLGWYRMLTAYADPMSFDQEFVYQGLDEPHNVYHSDFKDIDGSDLTQVLVVSDESVRDLRGMYGAKQTFKSWGSPDTVSDEEPDSILIAEYYELKYRDDELHQLSDGSVILDSEVRARLARNVEVPPRTGYSRKTRVPYVCWYKLDGAGELEKREYQIPHIPVFPVIGLCARIEGKINRAGLIRAARDPQRYYNWLKSAEAEYMQNAPKAPYLAAARAVQPYSDHWRNANAVNYGYLPYKDIDEQGNPIPKPERAMPMPIPAALVQAGLTATDDVKKALGMYSAAIGARGSATSGKQELAQQREADVGTFHYSDNLAKSVLHEGRVALAWIPKLYSSRHVARIIGIDGEPSTVKLTKMLPKAVNKVRTANGVESVYNLGVGKYDVTVSVGPSYTTQRQESAAMLTELARADATLMQKAGDLIFRQLDIPGNEDIADRLKAYQPPQIIQAESADDAEQGPEQLQAMMAQVQAGMQQIQERSQMLTEIEQKMGERDQEIEKKEGAVAQEQVQLAAEKQVLEARAAEISAQLELRALRAAQQVKQAAEDAGPPDDTGADVLADIQSERVAVATERKILAYEKRIAELELAARHKDGMQQMSALVQDDEDEDDMATPLSAPAPSAPGSMQTAPGAPAAVSPDYDGDMAMIKRALASLLEHAPVTAEELQRTVRAESERTRAAVTKIVADAKTVQVIPIYDDDGNMTGGEVVAANGKKRTIQLPERNEV